MLLANDIDNGADEKDCLFIANCCRKHIESLGGGASLLGICFCITNLSRFRITPDGDMIYTKRKGEISDES